MIDFNYDKNFTSNYVQKQVEESPFIDLMNVGYKGVTFTKQLLQNYPELFDSNGSVLYYIENCGKTVKPDFLYLAFETLMTNSNDNIVNAKLNNIPLFTVNQDNIIQWCRYLQHTSKFIIFEPILKTCNSVLKSFIEGDMKFTYKNINTSLQEISPLCVTNIGENVCDLMMYIAYVYNYLINCKPFIFNEVITGSSSNLFMESVNNHFNVSFTKLIENSSYSIPGATTVNNTFKFKSLDQFYSNVSNIEYFDKNEIRDVLTNMLDMNIIKHIRDNILMKNDELLNVSTRNQSAISDKFCYESFISVLNNLVDIVVKNNYYYKNIYLNIPTYSNKINYHELSLLTEYALSGGKHPFTIDNNDLYYSCCDCKTVKHFSNLQKQQLVTNIHKPHTVSNNSFTSNNIMLEVVTGYVTQQFEEYQNDVLYHPSINISEKEFDNDDIISEINALYLNGKYTLYSSQLHKILSYLLTLEEFSEEYNSLFDLSRLFRIFYNNSYSSNILESYILSYLPEYLLQFMCKNKSHKLSKFSFVTYFTLHHDKVNINRINKLLNMEMSIMVLHNKSYTEFVNSTVKDIVDIINTNSYIIQPYIKTVTNKIDMCCIGGVSLMSKCIDSNPFSRGYYFLSSTQGICENTFTFYEFIKCVESNFFELFTNAIKSNNMEYLKNLINNSYQKLLTSGKLPPSLYSFDINDNGTYTNRTYDYYTELSTSNNIKVYTLLANYSFEQILANNTQSYKFYSRLINKDKTCNKLITNSIQFNDKIYSCSCSDRGVEYLLPVYGFSSTITNVSLTFVQPSSFKLLQIYTPSNELQHNNVFFIFTQYRKQQKQHQKYNVYGTFPFEDIQYDPNKPTTNDVSNSGVNSEYNKQQIGIDIAKDDGNSIFSTSIDTTESSTRNLNNVPNTKSHLFPADRLTLTGINKQPITNE